MTIIIALLVLSVLVLVHELGHYTAAKIFKVDVEEFGIGLPPKARTLFKKEETEFTLNWLPLGGFVRLLGEDREQKIANPFKKRKALYSKLAWQRAIIMLSGIFANLVMGVVIFSVIYSVIGIPEIVGEQVVVVGVAQGSPADTAGIEQGDVIARVGDEEVANVDEFIAKIDENKGKMVSLYVGEMRSDGTVGDAFEQVSLIPRVDPPEGEGSLGVSISDIGNIVYEKKPWYTAPYHGAVEGIRESYFWGEEVLRGFAVVGRSLVKGSLPEGVAGPIGIVEVTAEVSESGLIATLRFMAILSINLAIFNLLPIPILDGGRLVMLSLEKVFGRKRIVKVEKWVYMAGMVLMALFFVLVTWNDIVN